MGWCFLVQEKLFYAQIWEEAKAWFDCFFETPETASLRKVCLQGE